MAPEISVAVIQWFYGGLGGYALTQGTNPLLFTRQVHSVTHILFATLAVAF